MRSYRRYFYDGFLRENGLKFAFFATVYREQLLDIFYLVVVFVKHLINVKLLSTFCQKPWPRLLDDLIGARALKTHFPASYSEFLSLFLALSINRGLYFGLVEQRYSPVFVRQVSGYLH